MMNRAITNRIVHRDPAFARPAHEVTKRVPYVVLTNPTSGDDWKAKTKHDESTLRRSAPRFAKSIEADDASKRMENAKLIADMSIDRGKSGDVDANESSFRKVNVFVSIFSCFFQ